MLGLESLDDQISSQCEWFAHRMQQYRFVAATPAEASRRRHFLCSSSGQDFRSMALGLRYTVAAVAELVYTAAAHPLRLWNHP